MDEQMIEGLFAAIAHGDEDHRAWLREAIVAFADGKPVPPPRGKGRTEAAHSVIAGTVAELTKQTLLVDRLCSAVDLAAEDIGHESIDELLKLIGPQNERCIELLGGRAALAPHPKARNEEDKV